MTRDVLPDLNRPAPPAPGRMVVAGVAGAVVLGVALGFWARPAEPGGPSVHVAARREPAGPSRPSLQIVVDEAPAAPIGEALEVLPTNALPARPLDLAPPMARQAPVLIEPVVPRRPTSGLMKVDAPAPLPPQVLAPRPKAEPPRKMKTEAPKTSLRIATAKADAKLAQAKATRDRKVAALAEAHAEKLEAARGTKLAKARAVKLAKSEARLGYKAEKVAVKSQAKAKPTRLAAKLAKTEAARVARPKPVKVAAAKLSPKPLRKPAAKHPAPRNDGSLRVARANVCASPDPGEAIVCADRSLGQRDRQLQAAYRSAEAAGVPASALRRQQSRWLAARAAAAREAPWAVEDVYVARISELKDQTRDARDN